MPRCGGAPEPGPWSGISSWNEEPRTPNSEFDRKLSGTTLCKSFFSNLERYVFFARVRVALGEEGGKKGRVGREEKREERVDGGGDERGCGWGGG